MNDKKILNWIITITLLSQLCFSQGCTEVSAGSAGSPQAADNPAAVQKESPVDEVLVKLNESAGRLKTYQCKIEYLFQQPLFDSQTLRTGEMFYLRDRKNSLLRINFESIKQDDEPQEKYAEHYVFDGVWLTRVDYQLKQVKMFQLIDPNDLRPEQSTDAFDLITEHLPIVGFTKTDRLKKEFEIEMAGSDENELKLHMKVKPDSVYADGYTAIDFEIEQKIYLPASITAYSVEEDIYQFKFIEPKVNEKIDRNIFDLKIPKDFPSPEINPLKKKDSPQSTQ